MRQAETAPVRGCRASSRRQGAGGFAAKRPEKVLRAGHHPSRIATNLGKSWQSLSRYKVAISMPLLRRLQARDGGHPLGKSLRP